MPDLTSDEWFELYRHLLASLRERQLAHIAEEIEAAAARPVIKDTTAEEEARISAISKEVGQISLRQRTPEEAFASAVEVLSARLLEIPQIAASLKENVAPNIVFRSAPEDVIYSEGTASEFTVDQLSLGASEVERIQREIATLSASTTPAKSA